MTGVYSFLPILFIHLLLLTNIASARCTNPYGGAVADGGVSSGAASTSGYSTFWSIQTLDSDYDKGKYTSITTDAAGNVHISYRDNTNRNLKYVTNRSGTWVIETVDESGTIALQ